MRRPVAALLLVVVGTGCWFLAPTSVGGSASYVVADGSMAPDVPEGALVVARERGHYEAGDVVAYRSGRHGSVDVRRILATDGDRYLVRGDAEAYADGYRPTAVDVLGTPMVTVPWFSTALAWTLSPAALVVLLGLLLLLFVEAAGHHHGPPTVRSRWAPRRP
jgi:hypothetical protein